LILRKIIKFLPPDVIFQNGNAPNLILAGAMPQTPLGSLQRSRNPLAGFEGPTSKGRRIGEGKA